MKTLKIADGLALPIDAATQTFAFIARKGAGKTYTAGKLVELFLDAGVQVVVLDTVGNWYGLRLAADGKGGGFDVPVLGGLRGDIPLEASGGALIADIVVETGRSLVVDASQFSLEDRKRFATAFGKQLWQRKKAERHPSPLHLVIEESQLIVPQDVRGDTATMVGIYEEIIRLGRNYGIGVSMITQRPQSVNKEVLNQTECLFVGQVNGAQERDALKKWITHQGMDVHLVGELPGLKVGTFYIWSPQWLNLLERVQILPKKTFDASATPKVGDKRVQRDLKTLDLSELQQQMSATIERQKADDPRELRKQLAEAHRELSQFRKLKSQPDKPAPSGKPVPVLTDADRELVKQLQDEFLIFSENIGAKADLMLNSITDRAKASIDDALKVWTSEVDKRRALFAERLDKTRVQKVLDKLERVSNEVIKLPPQTHHQERLGQSRPLPAAQPGRASVAARPAPRAAVTGGSENGLAPAQTKILGWLSWLARVGFTQPSKTQLALWCAVSPTSGGYFNNLGKLRSAGLIDYPTGGSVALTDEGAAAATSYEPDAPADPAELQENVYRIVGPAKAAIVRALIAIYPRDISKDELAERLGVSPTSGGYFNNLGALRTYRILDYPRPGFVKAEPVLFLEAS